MRLSRTLQHAWSIALQGGGSMVHEEARVLFAELGFVAIPLRARSKRPLRRGWREGLADHWRDAPEDVNIGILTGAPSGGLVVLDFDTQDGPERVLGMSPEQLSVLTIVVRTSRGWHVYARELGRATGVLCAGVDVRGEGGMVVAPPSLHPNGVRYEFLGLTRRVIPLASILPPRSTHDTFEVDMREIEAWIGLQAPKLQEAWRRLKEPPSASFDASKADFAVALCLCEAGYAPSEIAAILMRMPGSRAQERGSPYAIQTATRANEWALARRFKSR